MSFRLVTISAAALLAVAASAPPYRLAPFKDDLFAYREVLASEFDGDYLRVRYDKKRDMDDRSQAPRERYGADLYQTGGSPSTSHG